MRDDERVIAKWRSHRSFPHGPGDDGKGGFVGWANRLDERFGLVGDRSTHAPMRARELWQEMLRWPVLAATAAWVAVIVLAFAYVGAGSGIIVLIVGQAVMLWARSRVRERKIVEMRDEVSNLAA